MRSLASQCQFSSSCLTHALLVPCRERKGGQPYLQDDHQQASTHKQRDEAADEPAKPEDAIVQAHDPHGLLQPRLLLIHNALNDDSHRINPGQRHEKRHRPAHHPQEAGDPQEGHRENERHE